MTCKNVEKRLSAYLDNRLAAAERTEVESHLATCASCPQTLGLLRGAGRLLSQMGPAEPRPGLAERLARVAVAAERRPSLQSSWLASLFPMAWPWATATAAAAALLLVLAGGGAPPVDGDALPTAGILGATDLGLDSPRVAGSILGEDEL